MNRKILIVDDNEINRRYARAVLSGQDTELSTASNALEALALLENGMPDIILMDIQMPEIDGFQCLKMIRSKYPECPALIFAVTAFSDEYQKEYFKDQGFHDLIIKPVKSEVLKEKLKLQNNGHFQHSNVLNTNNYTIVNISIFNELLKFATREELISIYKDFKEETVSLIEDLKSHLESNEYEKILSILHTIKGNAASLGLDSLAKLTEEMETGIRNSGRLAEPNQVPMLIDLFGSFADNYERLLKTE